MDPAVANWDVELDVEMAPTEGIHLSDASQPEGDRVCEFLDGVRHAPFDHTAALSVGELSASLQREGAMLEIVDDSR